MAWDGEYLWHADSEEDADKIYKLNPSNGDVVDSFDAPGGGPRGLAWDGEYLWNVNYEILTDPLRELMVIYKLDPSNGDVVDNFATTYYDGTGLAWDGEHLWNASSDSDNLKIYELSVE